ncbi:MAG: hypothetical protein KKB50_19615 [Planctomycetes bacterium]|nr:hypothetical protein [Planctomycetota bacterium]
MSADSMSEFVTAVQPSTLNQEVHPGGLRDERHSGGARESLGRQEAPSYYDTDAELVIAGGVARGSLRRGHVNVQRNVRDVFDVLGSGNVAGSASAGGLPDIPSGLSHHFGARL